MNRRDFFKFLPVAPVVIAADVVSMAHADEAPEGPFGAITFQNHIKVKPESLPDVWNMPAGKYHTVFNGSSSEFYEKTFVQASLAVGSDGHLWMKPNGSQKWKRIVTE